MASDALHLGARVLLSPGHSHLSGFRSDSKHQDFALLSKGCARVCMCMCESSKDLWLAWSSVLRPALKLGSARPAICYPAHISKANSAPKPGQQKLRIPGVCAVCVCVVSFPLLRVFQCVNRVWGSTRDLCPGQRTDTQNKGHLWSSFMMSLQGVLALDGYPMPSAWQTHTYLIP